MKFAIPRIWREHTDHSSDCFFCMVDPPKRRSGKNTPAVFYPDIPSSIAVPHSADLPKRSQLSKESSKSENAVNKEGDCDITNTVVVRRNPYYPNQRDLNDHIRDLGLTKSNGELSISRLKECDSLDDSVRVTNQRKGH